MVKDFLIFILCLCFCPLALAKTPVCKDCNLLLISIDTLRPDHMGIYGYGRQTTPHIDKHLKDGVVLDNATTPSPCTIPSIKQFLSGRYDTNASRLAEIMRQAGYQTGAIISQALLRTAKEEKLHIAGFESWDIQKPYEENQHLMSTRDARSIQEAALDWLKRRNTNKPFFLWTHFFDPHDPYDPPAKYRQWLKGQELYTDGDRRLAAQKGGFQGQWQKRPGIFSDTARQNLIALYDGEIAFTDAHLGKMFTFLQQQGLWEKTVVVLVSDHGEWLGEEEMWDHCITLHEREVRVPLIFRIPGLTKRPHIEGQAFSTLDILPTLTNLLRVSDPHTHLREGSSIFKVEATRKTFASFRGEITLKNKLRKIYCSLEGTRCVAWRQVSLKKATPDEKELGQEVKAKAKATLTNFIKTQSAFLKTTDETLATLKALGYTR